MKAYADSDLSVSETSVKINQRVWVELKTTGLDERLVAMVIDSCWATKEVKPDSSPQYHLITKSCAKDKTVVMDKNGKGTSNSFSFTTFQFSKSTGDVYLHCQVKLCGLKKGKNCVPLLGFTGWYFSWGGGPAFITLDTVFLFFTPQDCTKSGRRRRSPNFLFEDGAPALVTMAWTS
ncbi:uncharacterized protein LOC117808825 [Xyrichtys novacula]|uniref:Uncharacterized protein LOC117808825 n=1 Tax=Xyrichtys novacula TaxID=13765 RepID=A0AAV1FV55_XYRNO|nr:uncharacterized protein LOC117808825 [Xyrichtys novacula]